MAVLKKVNNRQRVKHIAGYDLVANGCFVIIFQAESGRKSCLYVLYLDVVLSQLNFENRKSSTRVL